MVSQFARNLRSRLSSRTHLKALAGTVLLTSFVLTGLLVAFRQFGALEDMELGAYDRFIRWRPDEGLDERLLVVGISEEDIQRRNEFPLHDGTLAEALEKLLRDRPTAIGIDIGRDVPQGPAAGRERLIEVLQESDRLFAACLLSSATEPGVPGAPGVPADRIGFADLPQDPGGVVRRSILVSTPAPPPVRLGEPHLCNYADPDNQVLSLSFLLALVYLEQEGIAPEQTVFGEIQLGSVILPPLTESAGGYHSTGAEDYQLMLNYRSARNAVRQVTLTEVLQGEVDPAWISDRIVLIGYTSRVAKDTFATPYLATQEATRDMPGVVIHAQATSQILSAVLDGRPILWYLPEMVEIVWIWGWSLLGGTLAFYVRRTWQFMLAGSAALLVCYGLSYLLFLQGGWIPLVPSAIALVMTAAGVGFIDRATKAGYTQAIYEQLREQLQGGAVEQERKARQTDYLEDLVRRARAIRRQGEPEETLDSQPSQEEASSEAMAKSSPEVKDVDALYQQIREQVETDLDREGKTKEAKKAQLMARAKERRIQNLIERSRTARSHQQTKVEGSRVPIIPQDSTKAQSEDETETTEEA